MTNNFDFPTNKYMKTLLFPMFIESSNGGMQQIVLEMMTGLNKRGYICVYIGYEGSDVETYYKEKGINTIGLKKHHGVLQLAKFVKSLYATIGKYKNPLIITNDIYTHLLLSLYYKKKKELFVSHGGNYKSVGKEFAARTGYSAKIAKAFSFKRVDRFIAISDTQAKALIENAKVKEQKVNIIYNGYDCPKDYSQTIKTISQGVIKISIVGYIKRLKNQHIILDALKQLKAEGHDCILNLYGSVSDKEYHNELSELIKTKDLGNSIIFHGYVNDKEQIYQNTDILVSCSFHEGFGLSLIEAMSYKIPVIAYEKADGPSIIIDNGETGILVKENTSLEYYKAIKKLITDSNTYKSIQEKAFVKYQENFSLSTMIDKYDQIIKSI